MKTIGVLGGLGPQATMDFEARVHAASQKLIPPRANSGYPPMIVYYHRTAPIVVDENSQPVFPVEMHPALREKLEAFGKLADFLVITANGPHMLKDVFEQASGLKVLSIIDVTLQEAQNRGWRKLGLLGLGEPRVYMAPLDQLGAPYETLSGELEELRNSLDRAIIALMEGRAGPGETAIAMEAVEALRGKGADGIILGCTEIPLLLGEAAQAPDLINPAALLAEAAVRYALE
ncbi:MAG: aspartate/glutamate racemase family protein [Chloroflexota bacterium]|nr:aspartate/glutamate racemase family protein [Chloroflexota bacterium]